MWTYYAIKIQDMIDDKLFKIFRAVVTPPGGGGSGGSGGGTYIWSVPIMGAKDGGFGVWFSYVARVLIMSGIGITFISLGSSIFRVVFGGDENALTEEKKKIKKRLASLVLLVLSSLIVGAISPFI